MPAKCLACDGTVMSYRKYLFHMSSTAVCQSCGRKVRLRAYRQLLGVAVVIGLAWVLSLILTESKSLFLISTLVTVSVALALDFWSWRNLSWEVVEGEAG